MNFIIQWVFRHWSVLGIGLLLSWFTIGATYLALRHTTKNNFAPGSTQIIASDGYEPTIGCATGRQFIGWSHKKLK